MQEYGCRVEQPGDVAAIDRLVTDAFPTPIEARLVSALRAAGRLAISLVAIEANDVIGHIAFSPATAGPARGLGLAPLAVHAGHRRRGVGANLVREGLASCRERGETFVVVLGDPRYYGRFGFVAAAQHGLGNEYGAGEEFMVLALQPRGLPPTGSIVRYAPEFAAV